ncbi:dihydrofolate reductase family protein [Cellulosimicrobium cellulans]|uniref:dihydrofolate reductase family protein n=1 Tax=Cellulosimicrobium cellulans TaxID=1710 RepID=UPI002406C2B0|nr:dihydrofolate reductase family protein [Cellulosimicrobium cellulans]MDF9876932.1 dihydrofolate reductase [Cellulosimicrobium cellulans]
MGNVTCDVAVSVDGFSSRPDQTQEHPFGEGVDLHRWMFETADENRAELDAILAAGAFVMGRNMFTPGRGEWDLDWRGWWGPEPPYHGAVFVLAHHPREPLVMEGGTTFFFVTDGIESAVAQAREAAGDRDVSIAGGAATINQALAAGLLDELRLHVVPQALGHGDRVLDGVPPLALETVAVRAASLVTHVTYRVLGPLG